MLNIILKNAYALESFNEIRNAQPVSDRLHYAEIVLESTNSAANGLLVQKLYEDIISKSNIDFGKIDNSKGNLTNYEYYEKMQSSIDALNKLFEGRSNVPEITLMNDLHEMIISLRGDYEFGFKFDINIIKLTYNTAIMSLYEIINICIMIYTNYLRDVKGIEFDYKKKSKKELTVIKSSNSLIKMYKNGEWATIIKAFKKDGQNLFGSSLGDMLNAAGNVLSNNNSKPNSTVAKNISDAYTKLPSGAKTVTKIGTALAAIIALLMAIRGLIYWFFNKSAKVDNYIKTQNEFLDASIKYDDDNTADSIKKQEKLKNKLDKISNFIEISILKTQATTDRDITRSNTDNFTKQEFVDAGKITNDSIELF